MALCLVLGLATACSGAFTRLAYNNLALAYANLTPMLTWMVDDYVDISGSREDWVRARFERAIAWHRAEELPRYKVFLESTLALLAHPLRAEDIAARQKELRTFYLRVVDRLVPDTAEFLSGLDAADIAHLERKFFDDNKRYVKESVRGTPEERVARRAKRFVGHLESWVGSLEPAQRRMISERYADAVDLGDDLMGDRRFRQSEILALARARPARAEMEAALRRLLVNQESWRRPEMLAKLRERDAHMHALLAELSASMTPRQRESLQERVRGFLRDIVTINPAAA